MQSSSVGFTFQHNGMFLIRYKEDLMRVDNCGYLFATSAINAASGFIGSIGQTLTFLSGHNLGIVERFQKLTSQFGCNRIGLNRFCLHQTGECIMNPQEIIQKLGLEPLPGEGGFYRETYRSPEKVKIPNKGSGTHIDRSLSTAIYFMVTPSNFSALHRIVQDEVYHFYAGQPVELFLIGEDGKHQLLTLGNNILENQLPQIVVPGGTWQGARLKAGSNGWSLMGTTVAPGFDFADFELGDRSQLLKSHPELKQLIVLYTR